MNCAELSLELGQVVLVRDFIGPSGLVRVVSGPSCPAPMQTPIETEILVQLLLDSAGVFSDLKDSQGKNAIKDTETLSKKLCPSY